MSDWFEDAASANAVDVSDLWTAEVQDAFAVVVAAGALVSCGLSSDGGALGVTVTSDGRWRRDWFREADALAKWLLGAATFLTNGGQPATSGNGSRPRQRRPRAPAKP